MTGTEARTIVNKALSDLDNIRAAASNSGNVLSKSSLEIIDGAKTELVKVSKQIPDGALPVGVNSISWNLKNALARVDAAIKTVSQYGIKSKSDLGMTYAKAFAEQAKITGVAVGNVVSTVGNTIGNTVSSLASGLFSGLGIWAVVLVVAVGLIIYFKVYKNG
jgi:hypothetical protein